jgi:type VI secretion system protein ImpL
MGPLVGEFLAQAFGTQVNHKPLQLRGAYYTSGTQEGNPIDRVLVALSRTFRLDRAGASGIRTTGKSFFLTRLLREVVFSEAELATVESAS